MGADGGLAGAVTALLARMHVLVVGGMGMSGHSFVSCGRCWIAPGELNGWLEAKRQQRWRRIMNPDLFGVLVSTQAIGVTRHTLGVARWETVGKRLDIRTRFPVFHTMVHWMLI